MPFSKEIENALAWAGKRVESTEYRLRCLAFVEDAYERSNEIEIWGGDDASGSCELYEARKNECNPPPGSFVFYDASGPIDGQFKNWGHVGLSLGNGELIHAWDKVRIDHYLAVESLTPAPGWSAPKFSGWAPVERILASMQKRRWD